MKRAYAVVILIVLVLGVFGISRVQKARKVAVKDEKQEVVVEVIEPAVGMMAETVVLTGSIAPDSEVEVASSMAGRVLFRAGDEGSRVSRGQVLVRLQDRELQAQRASAQAALASARARLDAMNAGARPQERDQVENAVRQAEAGYENARKNYERLKSLYSQGALAQQQLDLAQSQFVAAESQLSSARAQRSLVNEGVRREDIRSAEAGVAQARGTLQLIDAQLANTVVRAPVSGVISYCAVEPGEMAMPGVPLFRITDQGRLFLEARVPEREFVRLRRGQSAVVTVDALPGFNVSGRVEELVPVADQKNRAFKVRIALNGDTVKPGMFGRAEVAVTRERQVVSLPGDILREQDGRNYVLVVENGKARRMDVKTGLTRDGQVEVIGLDPNLPVVSVGQDGLNDGESVKIVERKN